MFTRNISLFFALLGGLYINQVLAAGTTQPTMLLAVAPSTVPVATSTPPVALPSTPPIGGRDDQSTAMKELMECDGTLEYFPVPAFEASDYTFVELSDEGVPSVKKKNFPKEPKEINNLLPNLSMDVSVEEVDVEAGFPFFKSKIYHRKIVMDFMKSRTEPIVDQNKMFYGYGRVGAGLRLKIDLWTTDSSFDGSLIGLAASAKAKTSRGNLSAQTVGMNNSDITLSMPFSADFSEGSIQKIIEALAVVKSKIHDENKTSLSPHVLARVGCKKGGV